MRLRIHYWHPWHQLAPHPGGSGLLYTPTSGRLTLGILPSFGPTVFIPTDTVEIIFRDCARFTAAQFMQYQGNGIRGIVTEYGRQKQAGFDIHLRGYCRDRHREGFGLGHGVERVGTRCLVNPGVMAAVVSKTRWSILTPRRVEHDDASRNASVPTSASSRFRPGYSRHDADNRRARCPKSAEMYHS